MRLEYAWVAASETTRTLWPLFVLPASQAKNFAQRREAETGHLQTEQSLGKSVES